MTAHHDAAAGGDAVGGVRGTGGPHGNNAHDNNGVRSLRATFSAVRRHPLAVIVPVVVDFIALLLFASLYSSLFIAATSQIATINEILGAETAAFVASGGTAAIGDAALAESEALLSTQMAALVVNILLICMLAYVLFTLSQTLAWWLAHRAVRGPSHHGKDMAGALSDLGTLLLRMLTLNALWFALMLAVLGFSGYMMGQAGSSPVPILGPGFYVTLAIVALVVLTYLMTVSHAFILQTKPLRTSMRMAFLHAARYGVPFCVICLGLIAFTFIIPPLGAWHYAVGILAFLVLLGWFAFGRIWLAEIATAEVRA